MIQFDLTKCCHSFIERYTVCMHLYVEHCKFLGNKNPVGSTNAYLKPNCVQIMIRTTLDCIRRNSYYHFTQIYYQRNFDTHDRYIVIVTMPLIFGDILKVMYYYSKMIQISINFCIDVIKEIVVIHLWHGPLQCNVVTLLEVQVGLNPWIQSHIKFASCWIWRNYHQSINWAALFSNE